jgi:hypothetical protein
MFRSAIASRLWKRIFCGVLFSGESKRHDGQPTPSTVPDSSAIDAHLIKCIVRQNHR